MIVDRMHQEFKVGVDKTDSFNSANFLTEEIDLYLSDAQEEFIEQIAYGNNIKGLSVEETQQQVKNLQDLTVNANLFTFIQNSTNKPNGTYVALPDGLTILDASGVLLPEYRHALNEEVTVEYRDCNGSPTQVRVPVVATTHDRYNRMIASPFSRPNLNKVYRIPYGRINNVEYFELILGAGQTLIMYHLVYLFNPRKIDKAQILVPPGLPGTSQGDLTDTSYRTVVRIAVRNALGDIVSPNTPDSIQKLKEIN